MDGITAAFVTGKAVRPEDWDVEMNQVKKSHPEHAIINAHLEEFRLKVRCYTGMAFADIKNLKQESIIHNIDGSIWIIYHRQKTKIIAKIKLLKTAISIRHRSTHASLIQRSRQTWMNWKGNYRCTNESGQIHFSRLLYETSEICGNKSTLFVRLCGFISTLLYLCTKKD
jgi:hypothetical protein